MSTEPTPADPNRLDRIETRWSLVRRCHVNESRDAIAARQALVLRYASAIRSYCRAIVGSNVDADEVSQDFVVRLLQGDFGGADPNRGRFRDLLRTAIRNLARNRWSRENRRGGHAELNDEHHVDPENSEVEDPWLAQWRTSLLENAWSELRAMQDATPGSCLYSILRLRTDHPEESSEQLASRVSQQIGRTINAAAARQNLRRARVRFCELLVDEVADGLEDASRDRVQEELIALDLWSQIKDMLPADWLPYRSASNGNTAPPERE